MITKLLTPTTKKTSTLQTIFRFLLGLFLLFAGISHLSFARVEFLAQVPRWIPLEPDLVVILSGIVEISLGAALLVLPKYRVLFGWVTASFFIAIFPGNIAQYLNGIDAFGLNSDLTRGIRLLFQPVLVLWALWSSGAWRAWRDSRVKNKKE
ncbi:MAG: hypothetical protein CL609_17550 [Anaerolineaceae bacterium]|nr:hypothetical protein [Anaerolineaceae bacterium]